LTSHVEVISRAILIIGSDPVPTTTGPSRNLKFQGGHMIAKVIIKRRFKPGKSRQIIALLNELRARAMHQTGYISGETLSKKGFPNNLIVIGSWQSLDAWQRWRDSDERKKYEAMLELLQERPTEYEEYLLGTPLSLDE
jgi:heme-degrading monooxygenase HmoA